MANNQQPFIGVHLVLIQDGQILLGKRTDHLLKDTYMMVAGHVEEGENIFSAMIREAKEEANIILDEKDLKLACVVHHPNAPYKGRHHDIINFFIMADTYQGTVCNNEPEKCPELNWYPLSNLPRLSVHTKAALEAIQNGQNCVVIS
ncbi:MAG: NUDIX domain-containing protein [Alphaproteobacteria bacterium]|nr:NUDIX domain-containing protein [Alphaproteobacteria bacterium]